MKTTIITMGLFSLLALSSCNNDHEGNPAGQSISDPEGEVENRGNYENDENRNDMDTVSADEEY
jgi:hypothetical protein